jgi:hypothetical protein
MEAFQQLDTSKSLVTTGLPTPQVMQTIHTHLGLFQRHVFALVCDLTGGVSVAELAEAGEYISPQNYGDAVTERVMGGACGYPACASRLPTPRLTLPLGEYLARERAAKEGGPGGSEGSSQEVGRLESYCSRWCWKCSRFYAAQLRDVAPAVRMAERAAAAASGARRAPLEVVPPATEIKRLGVVVPATPPPPTPQGEEVGGEGGVDPVKAAQLMVKQRAEGNLRVLQEEMGKLALQGGPSSSHSKGPGGKPNVVGALVEGQVGFSTLPREGEEDWEEGEGEKGKLTAALSIEGHFVAPMKMEGGKKAVKASAAAAALPLSVGQEAVTSAAEEMEREEKEEEEVEADAEEEEGEEEVLIEASVLQSSRRQGTTVHPSLLPQNYPRPKDLAPSLAKPFPTGLGTQFLDLSK